jgi:hypothetical protein
MTELVPRPVLHAEVFSPRMTSACLYPQVHDFLIRCSISVEISSMPLAPLVSFSSETIQNSLFDIIY